MPVSSSHSANMCKSLRLKGEIAERGERMSQGQGNSEQFVAEFKEGKRLKVISVNIYQEQVLVLWNLKTNELTHKKHK